jgi:subtilisin family serine protease
MKIFNVYDSLIIFFLLSLAGNVFAEPLAVPSTINKASVVNNEDYYILNTGKKASFLRLENTYLIINDRKITSPAALSNLIQSQFGSQLKVVTEGELVAVEITGFRDTSQILSDMAQIDPSVSFISQVLINPKTGAQLGIVPEIIVRITADLNEVVTDLQVHNLSLISKLAFTDREYQFAIDEDITDIGRIFEITRAVAALPSIEWAEPNFIAAAKKTVFTPNDPLFGEQWHLHNTSQGGGLSDADVDAPEGWDISKGTGAVIAVFDDGVETTHEDLTIWSNPGETGGGKESNGIDDDGNGYIDDYQGWDFGDNDNDPNPATADDNHGTAVAGVAGATGNNSVGVTGNAVEAVILPVRMMSGSCTDWGNATRYAGKYADVVNNSWGIDGCESALNSAISDVVNGNIAGARRGTKGAPVLFATGNAASGWERFTLTGFSAGTYTFSWQFLKNSSISQGYDTIWLDNITWPGGDTTDFESDSVGSVPSGFTSYGDGQWAVVSDGTHAWNASGKSVKAATIGDSQHSVLEITKAVGAGTLYFWAWVSSESDYDYMNFYVDGIRYIQYAPGQDEVHQNSVGYPASNPDTIAVGASHDGLGNLEQRSAYSQFGPEVDVVAPSNGGASGITTTDRSGSAGYVSGNYTSDFGGTSSATPLVAGIVANIITHAPTLTAAEIRDILHQGTDQIGPYAYPGGRNDYYGYGRVNLNKALQAVTTNPGTLQFSSATYSITENGGQASIIVTRTGSSDGAITVDYATSDDSATAGSDYTATSGTLNWADGETANKTFTITINDDSQVEDNETLIISLNNATGGAVLGEPDTAVLTITDNDSSTGFNCTTVTEISPEECQALVEIYNSTDGDNWKSHTGWNVTNTPCSWHGIQCSGGHITRLYLQYNRLSGTIPPEIENLSHLAVLNIKNNALCGMIPIELMNLTHLWFLSLDSNHLSASDSGLIAWLNNLNPGWESTQTSCPVPSSSTLQLSSATYSITENGGQASIIVTRTGSSDGAITVDYATSDDSATAGSDYTATSGTLNWADGETANKTFTITINDDSQIEGNETLIISLNNATGGAVLGEPDTAVLTITDNDSSTGFNCTTVTEISPEECQALVEIYNSTDGDNWKSHTGWNVTNTPCSWHGIQCSGGHITRLYLQYNRLSGTIPPEIENLSHLAVLNIKNNALCGMIPIELMNLTQLWALSLDTNHLSASDSGLIAWLNNLNPGWESTQTSCP